LGTNRHRAAAKDSTAQAAKYFVFVTGSGIVRKIVVSLLAPLIGRRALGILWGFSAAAALAAAAFLRWVYDRRRASNGSTALRFGLFVSRAALQTSRPIFVICRITRNG
jgi:hypothetical protein